MLGQAGQTSCFPRTGTSCFQTTYSLQLEHCFAIELLCPLCPQRLIPGCAYAGLSREVLRARATAVACVALDRVLVHLRRGRCVWVVVLGAPWGDGAWCTADDDARMMLASPYDDDAGAQQRWQVRYCDDARCTTWLVVAWLHWVAFARVFLYGIQLGQDACAIYGFIIYKLMEFVNPTHVLMEFLSGLSSAHPLSFCHTMGFGCYFCWQLHMEDEQGSDIMGSNLACCTTLKNPCLRALVWCNVRSCKAVYATHVPTLPQSLKMLLAPVFAQVPRAVGCAAQGGTCTTAPTGSTGAAAAAAVAVRKCPRQCKQAQQASQARQH
eukprot:scaffold96073_cov25-Tisochrysis_lutea.AAC.1